MPPRFWRGILALVVPSADRSQLMDELARLWRRKVERDGEVRAKRWYRREVLAFCMRWPAERVRRSARTRGGDVIDVARQVKRTVRGLTRIPGFTAVAVLTLALGIGANAVIFGIVDRALMRPLPYPEPDRLVRVFDGWATNLATADILRDGMRTVSAIGAANDATGRTYEPEGGSARRVTVAEVSPGYFDAIGVVPRVGRLFVPEESRPGSGAVAVVSSDFWRTALGGDAGVLERDLLLDGRRHVVVGVLPEGFDFPSGRNEIWVPATVDAANPGLYWGAGTYTVVARMAGGASPAQADPLLEQVALASTIPFGGEDEYMATFVPGVTDDPNDLPVTRHHRVTPSYFDAAGIPVLRGRGLLESDRLGTPLVAVIDETFADRFFPGDDPVGRTVRYPWRGAPDIRIVGVVGAVRDGELSAALEPTFWVPLAQMGLGPLGHAMVVATASGDPAAALSAIMARLRQHDARIAVSELLTYEQRLGASLAGTRLFATLLLVFALTALALGCIGVYGVAAFSVRERLREIGVRMAIGASVSTIRRSVLRDGLLLALPGSIAGLLLAVPATRAMAGLLFGVTPLDPLTFLAGPIVLGACALLAVYLPARRATSVDPATVLRREG